MKGVEITGQAMADNDDFVENGSLTTLQDRLRELTDLFELHMVKRSDFRGIRNMVDLAVINFLNAVSAERLHASRAGHGGGGHDLRLATAKQAAQIHLGMEHEFLSRLAVIPEALRRIVAGREAVVSGADHAVIVVESGGTDFSIGIFRAQARDMGEGHGVLGDGQTASGHGERVRCDA